MDDEIDSVMDGAPRSVELPALRVATGLESARVFGESDCFCDSDCFGESRIGTGCAATDTGGAGSAFGLGEATVILGVWGTTNFGEGNLAGGGGATADLV